MPSPATVSPSAAVLSLTLNEGWTWFSLNLVAADMSVGSLLSSVSFSGGDQLKSQASFTEYYPGYGFFGQLSTLTTDTMYALKLMAASSLSVSGTPVSLPKSATLADGWTWLPSPYQGTVTLSDAAPVFSYQQGDQIKSQAAFSEFYAGFGWFGTLTTMQPGAGYRVKVAAGGSATFQSQRRQ